MVDERWKLKEYYVNNLVRDPSVTLIDVNFPFRGHRFCEPAEGRTPKEHNERSWLYSLRWPDCVPLVEEVVEV